MRSTGFSTKPQRAADERIWPEVALAPTAAGHFHVATPNYFRHKMRRGSRAQEHHRGQPHCSLCRLETHVALSKRPHRPNYNPLLGSGEHMSCVLVHEADVGKAAGIHAETMSWTKDSF